MGSAQGIGCDRLRELSDEAILPPLYDRTVAMKLAVAVGLKAQASGQAQLALSRDHLERQAIAKIDNARVSIIRPVADGLIPVPPPEQD